MATVTLTAERNPSIDELEALCKKLVNAEYAIMRHDKDIASDHYHIAIAYSSPRSVASIANALNMPANFVAKWDNRKNNLFSYLTHTTAEARAEKYHYDDYLDDATKCRANFNLKELISRATVASGLSKVDEYAHAILDGKITKRELLNDENKHFYWNHKTKLDRAIDIRTQSLIYNPPKCSTILITGKPASGKTTLATRLARFLCGASVVFASGANDPLQDYTGEKCMIFDDFRPSDYEWINLLALLDPNYRQRTHQSRYYNKPLATELIILTSVYSIYDIEKYYHDLLPKEPMQQLFRRVGTVINLDTNAQSIYDEASGQYLLNPAPFNLNEIEATEHDDN